MIALTRRYPFSAAHVLARPDWSAEKNREVYGKCANPNGHGHAYAIEVTVRGDPDPATGMLLPIRTLDGVVRERITSALDRKLLRCGAPPFSGQIPTAENIARFAWRALAGRVSPAVLHRIRLVETANNSVEYSEDPQAE